MRIKGPFFGDVGQMCIFLRGFKHTLQHFLTDFENDECIHRSLPDQAKEDLWVWPTQWKGNLYHAVHVIFAHCRGSVRRSRVTGSSLIVRTNTEGRHVSVQMKLEYGFAHDYKSHSYHFLLPQVSVAIEHLPSKSTALADLADNLARSSTTSPSQLNSIRHAHSLPAPSEDWTLPIKLLHHVNSHRYPVVTLLYGKMDCSLPFEMSSLIN